LPGLSKFHAKDYSRLIFLRTRPWAGTAVLYGDIPKREIYCCLEAISDARILQRAWGKSNITPGFFCNLVA
jgi:hypothetical protein